MPNRQSAFRGIAVLETCFGLLATVEKAWRIAADKRHIESDTKKVRRASEAFNMQLQLVLARLIPRLNIDPFDSLRHKVLAVAVSPAATAE